MLGLALPVDNVSVRAQSFGLELYEIQRFLCANPCLKLVEVYTASSPSQAPSQGVSKTNPLVKKLFSLVPKYRGSTSEQFTSLNSLLIARGPQDLPEYSTKGVVAQIWQDFEFIKKSVQPVKWNPFTIDLWSSRSAISEPKAPALAKTTAATNSLTIAVNRNKCVEYLREVCDKSREKYAVGAYLHWYEKFSVSGDHFRAAFDNLNTIIDSYEQMTL